MQDLLVTTCSCIPLLLHMYYLLQELRLIICFVFRFWCVFDICANYLLILVINLIHSQELITKFALFVRRWYLLKITNVDLVTTYVMVAMITASISLVSSSGLVRSGSSTRDVVVVP